jgi:hypothetical protein
VTTHADESTTQLPAAAEELGPVWRGRMGEHDKTSTFPYENLAWA